MFQLLDKPLSPGSIKHGMKKVIMFLSIALMMPFGAHAAYIDPINNFAWGENIGWVDFEETQITDTEVSGYAYGSNIGWLSLNCSNTDVCDSVSYGVTNDGLGNLSGYAWGENIGWIDFSGVSIDAQGDFLGYAYSPNTGYISFNCLNTNTCEDIDFKVALLTEKTGGDDEGVSTSTPSTATSTSDTSTRGRRGSRKFDTATTNTAPQGQLSAAEIITGPEGNQPTGSYLDANRFSSSTVDLYFGMTHPNVKQLQHLLNSLGYTLTESGPGSLGNETNYFGTLTQNALIKYQKDNNVVPAVGYYGPITRASLALKGF